MRVAEVDTGCRREIWGKREEIGYRAESFSSLEATKEIFRESNERGEDEHVKDCQQRTRRRAGRRLSE